MNLEVLEEWIGKGCALERNGTVLAVGEGMRTTKWWAYGGMEVMWIGNGYTTGTGREVGMAQPMV